MPSIDRARWKCLINSIEYRVSNVTINFALGSVVPTVVDLDIESPTIITPGVTTPVELWYIDRDALEQWLVFSGAVQQPLGVSYPNRLQLRCAGPLALLRDVWDDDHDFTGDTDGEAIIATLNAAGVPFDPGNIQDGEYELGELQDIKAPVDQKKWTFAEALNRVQRMVLIEIGGEVHRFMPQWLPDETWIVRTFVRGVDGEFWGNERAMGPIDDIRNQWKVTGVTYPCGPIEEGQEEPSCRCTVWAEALGTNPALGSRRRVEPGGETSELIQSTDMAEWLALQLTLYHNRVPDYVTLIAPFDPELHVGDTIGLEDPIRGINLTDTMPYVIERIDVSNFTSTYTLRGGQPLDEPTISSGVEKQCNQDTSPGPPTPPATGPSPWPRIEVFPEPWNPCDDQDPENPHECEPQAELTDNLVTLNGASWRIDGTIQLTDDSDAVTVGMDTTDGNFTLRIAGSSYYGGFMITPQLWELNGPGAYYAHEDGVVTVGRTYNFVLQWNADDFTLYFLLSIDEDRCDYRTIEFDSEAYAVPTTIYDTIGSPVVEANILYDCGVEGGGTPAEPVNWFELDSNNMTLVPDSNGCQFIVPVIAWGGGGKPEGIAETDAAVFVGASGLPDVLVTGKATITDQTYSMEFSVFGDQGFSAGWTMGGNLTASEEFVIGLFHTGAGSAYPGGDVSGDIATDFIPDVEIEWELRMLPSSDYISLRFIQGSTEMLIVNEGNDWYTTGTPEEFIFDCAAFSYEPENPPNSSVAGFIDISDVEAFYL